MHARLLKFGILLVLLAGAWLRVHGIGTQLVFADEIHALDAVRDHGYGYLLTHISLTDRCIPLTLYYRALMDTVGLNEWLMRLPAVVSGCATILLLGVFAWRRYGFLAGWFAAGMLAFSPYHVYLSREARPYPIVIFLLLAAVIAVFEWADRSSEHALLLGAAAAALALYFHLLALPLIAGLAFFVLRRGLGESRRARIAILRAGALFALLFALFYLPAAISLVETTMARMSRGEQSLATLSDGIYLLFALTGKDWIWETALAGAGCFWLWQQRKRDAGWFAFLIVLQVLAVRIANPESSQIPWVWARYVAFALPLWILLIAAGLAELVNRIKAPYLPGLTALVLLSSLVIADRGLYGLNDNRNFLVHPMVMVRDLDSTILASLPISPFYRKVAAEGSGSGILEMPLNFVFPLYDLEQRVHGKPVYSASLGDGLWQDVFNRSDKFRFQRTISASDIASDLPIKYIVVHKALGEEITRVYRDLKGIPEAARMLDDFMATLTPEAFKALFGSSLTLQATVAAMKGPPIYQDRDIAVYLFRPQNGSDSRRTPDSGSNVKLNQASVTVNW